MLNLLGFSRVSLIIELLVLYLVVPILLAIKAHIAFKLVVVFCALSYAILLSRKLALFDKPILIGTKGCGGMKRILARFLVFAVFSTFAMWAFDPERFFYVAQNQPLLWIGISIFYSFFSVYPQEFLYRTLFFARYQNLFHDYRVLIVVNALIFSLAHLMFNSAFILLLTFCGGILFAYTYLKTRSLVIVSVEHSAYGVWLYTLGIGYLLAFPG